MRTSFDAETTKFDVVTHMVTEGTCGSPIPVRACSQRSPILGVPYIYAYTLCRRTTKFEVVTHMGRGLVFRLDA